MKNQKIKISLFMIIFGLISISQSAKAETYMMSYTDTSNGHFANFVMTMQTQKFEYDKKEDLYSSVSINSMNALCANGQQLGSPTAHVTFTDYMVGKPDPSRQIKTTSLIERPEFYLMNGTIYRNGASIIGPGSTIHNSEISNEYIPISPKGIVSAEIHSNGDIYGNYYTYKIGHGYDSGTEEEIHYNEFIAHDDDWKNSVIANGGWWVVINEYLPTLITKNTGYYQVSSPLYRSPRISSVKIPDSAESGDYVAQINFNPSWTRLIEPTDTTIGGPWFASLKRENKNNFFAKVLKEINIFGVEKASAINELMMTIDINEGGGGYVPPSGGSGSSSGTTYTCTGWYCNVNLNSITLSTAFKIKATATSSSLEIMTK